MKFSLKTPEADTGRTPVQVAVLGCSDIAWRKFMPALANCDGARLTAVSSRSKSKAALFAGSSGCLPLTHEELLSLPAVDLVYLSLPNHLHEEWAIKVLEAGKHLICEKPLATSLASAERILDCASRNRRLLYENQMFLFHPQYSVVKEMIAAGKIGSIRELRSFFGFPFPRKADFRLDPFQGGGAFHDLARYPLGMACHLLSGIPQHFAGHATWDHDLNTGVTGTAITPDNEVFIFSIRFGQQYEALCEIVGENGRIRVERAYTTPPELENRITLTTGDRTIETVVPAGDHFKIMIESICTLIRTDSDYSCLNRQAATIAKLAELMKQGCMEKRYAQ